MSFKKQLKLLLILAAISSCDDTEETPSNPSNPDEDTFVCDPVGDNQALGDILNAPLGDSVEVIVKTPTHPGLPGPLNLP